MSDTIYKYEAESNEILPVWVFKGKFVPATKKDLDEKSYDLALEALATTKAKRLSTGIDQLHSTDNYIHFTFGWMSVIQKIIYFCIYKK